jgi:hypothetical protein
MVVPVVGSPVANQTPDPVTYPYRVGVGAGLPAAAGTASRRVEGGVDRALSCVCPFA